VKECQSIRKLASNVGMAKTTISNLLHPRKPGEEAIIKQHVSKLKPTSTEKNMLERYMFASDQLNNATAHLHRPRFLDQMDRVHKDEKWSTSVKMGSGTFLLLMKSLRSSM